MSYDFDFVTEIGVLNCQESFKWQHRHPELLNCLLSLKLHTQCTVTIVKLM